MCIRDRDGEDNNSLNFIDLKRNLAIVTEQEWLNLPEASDITKKNRRSRLEEQSERKTFAAPDTLFQPIVNLSKLTEERERLIGFHLDSSFKPSNSDDLAEKYLMDLDNIFAAPPQVDIGMLRDKRSVLASYRKTKPRNAESWIASARLEEKLNRLTRARELIEEGCKLCPRNEDIWLENIRLNFSSQQYCKSIMADAIRFNENSEKLWLKAIDLEQVDADKKRIVRKAILRIPSSLSLWKIAVELESEKTELIKILKKALEFIPESIEFWNLLVNLQDTAAARITLETARTKLGSNQSLVILGCQLEENDGVSDESTLRNIISDVIEKKHSNGERSLTLLEWIQEAVDVNNTGKHPLTANAIIQASIGILFDERSMKIDDIVELVSNKVPLVTSVYSAILTKYPTKYSTWKSFIKIAKENKQTGILNNTFDNILFNDQKLVTRYPILALMYTKAIWNWGANTDDAIKIIDKALAFYPTFPEFWVAKLKILKVGNFSLEAIVECYTQAMKAVENTDETVPSFFIKLMLQAKNFDLAMQVFNDMSSKVTMSSNLYILKAELYEEMEDIRVAQETLLEATKKFPTEEPVWIAAANLETKSKKLETARSILATALTNIPESDTLYAARADIEMKGSDTKQARYIIQQGLRINQNSWRLWCGNISLIPKKSMRKIIFQDALAATKEHPMVLAQIGKVFMKELQYEKAYKWFSRAIQTNPQYGDSWVWLYYCNLKKNGTDSERESIKKELMEQEPRYGPLWEHALNSCKNFSSSPIKILNTILHDLDN